MGVIDLIPRMMVRRWSAGLSDNSDAEGRAIAVEWLGFTAELGVGRRAVMWREHPEWLAMVRETGTGTLAEQQARLRALEPTHV